MTILPSLLPCCSNASNLPTHNPLDTDTLISPEFLKIVSDLEDFIRQTKLLMAMSNIEEDKILP